MCLQYIDRCDDTSCSNKEYSLSLVCWVKGVCLGGVFGVWIKTPDSHLHISGLFNSGEFLVDCEQHSKYLDENVSCMALITALIVCS